MRSCQPQQQEVVLWWHYSPWSFLHGVWFDCQPQQRSCGHQVWEASIMWSVRAWREHADLWQAAEVPCSVSSSRCLQSCLWRFNIPAFCWFCSDISYHRHLAKGVPSQTWSCAWAPVRLLKAALSSMLRHASVRLQWHVLYFILSSVVTFLAG